MRARLKRLGAVTAVGTLLGACFAPGHLPPEDAATRRLPTPELLPLSDVVAQARAQDSAPTMPPGLEARASALNARAARLRATSFTRQERDAITGMQSRHR